jgi:hypothetical protein
MDADSRAKSSSVSKITPKRPETGTQHALRRLLRVLCKLLGISDLRRLAFPLQTPTEEGFMEIVEPQLRALPDCVQGAAM